MPARGTRSPRSTESLVKQAMKMAVNDVDGEGVKKIRQICIALVNKAAKGDVQAANVIFDRLDGKPAQAVDLGGQEDNPVLTEILVRHVSSDND